MAFSGILPGVQPFVFEDLADGELGFADGFEVVELADLDLAADLFRSFLEGIHFEEIPFDLGRTDLLSLFQIAFGR